MIRLKIAQGVSEQGDLKKGSFERMVCMYEESRLCRPIHSSLTTNRKTGFLATRRIFFKPFQ